MEYILYIIWQILPREAKKTWTRNTMYREGWKRYLERDR